MKEASQGLDVNGATGRQNHQSAELRDCDRVVDVSDRACRDGHQHARSGQQALAQSRSALTAYSSRFDQRARDR
jgi:hypothetical protein